MWRVLYKTLCNKLITVTHFWSCSLQKYLNMNGDIKLEMKGGDILPLHDAPLPKLLADGIWNNPNDRQC